MRNAKKRMGLIVLAALGIAAAATAAVDHADHSHQLVRIGENRVHPKVQNIGSDDAIGWINYSNKIARVSFAAEVADKMVCKSPSGFRLTGPRLESPDIQAFQFATVCSLAKGEYAYKIELRSGFGGVAGGVPETIEGKIVVQ